MNKSFIFKTLSILMLTLLMSWAVSYVNSLILERQLRQTEVKQKIAKSSAHEQTIVGPVLVLSYEEHPETSVQGKDSIAITGSNYGKIYLFPEDLNLNGNFSNEVKSLGIYKALMYQLAGNVNGKFKIPKNLGLKLEHENSIIKITDAYLSIGIADTRGLTGKPLLNWNGQVASFQQGSKLASISNGLNAPIQAFNVNEEQTIPFEFKLNLRGMESFNFVPMAENNTIALNSNWQHPHFNGSFLPDGDSEKIDSSGFSAKWAVSSLSSNNQATLINSLKSANNNPSLESLSVGFIEPINVYSQADRATKYGLLFIGLTFAGFFIFEILKNLRIHPAQYTFVGLAMALFYLLLVSLAERIGFAYAYLSASFACISLLGYYLTYVLKSKNNGILFAFLLTSLYGALYAILASEDNALLMGSLLVFGLLSLTMIVTRKVDWYQISNKSETLNHANPTYL